MQKLNFIYWLSLIAMVTLLSCTGDEYDITTESESAIIPEQITINSTASSLINRIFRSQMAGFESKQGWGFDCGKILYPFSLVSTEGEIIVILNEDELKNVFEKYKDDQAQNLFVDFVYPLKVLDASGEVTDILTANELFDLNISCIPNGGWEENQFPAHYLNEQSDCFEVIYPFQVQDAKGNSITISNAEEEDRLNKEEDLILLYPLSLNLDGQIIIINNDAELLETLLSSCIFKEIDWVEVIGIVACNMIEYPIDIITKDGNMISVETNEVFGSLLIRGTFEQFIYPVTLISEKGDKIIVSSAEELGAANRRCEGYFYKEELLILILLSISGSNDACLSVEYPINARTKLDGGVELIFNNEDEVLEYLEEAQTNENKLIYPVYPISITINADDSKIEINSLEEFIDIAEECFK